MSRAIAVAAADPEAITVKIAATGALAADLAALHPDDY